MLRAPELSPAPNRAVQPGPKLYAPPLRSASLFRPAPGSRSEERNLKRAATGVFAREAGQCGFLGSLAPWRPVLMPIRALCTICSDFFDHSRDVAAIHCGHTFHLQW